ncbi:hypothetical protein O9K51_10798 [Purpureocillium lavendulum]|uniref:Uncharacterized protein n=1 Tax=Purpureocillium lavendulum TaxID=1247861 RepID=A0AB34FCH8_9HYPO|nr:hypothetical protein O9K51_10798 [Purpureocillium lavendulum]
MKYESAVTILTFLAAQGAIAAPTEAKRAAQIDSLANHAPLNEKAVEKALEEWSVPEPWEKRQWMPYGKEFENERRQWMPYSKDFGNENEKRQWMPYGKDFKNEKRQWMPYGKEFEGDIEGKVTH